MSWSVGGDGVRGGRDGGVGEGLGEEEGNGMWGDGMGRGGKVGVFGVGRLWGIR